MVYELSRLNIEGEYLSHTLLVPCENMQKVFVRFARNVKFLRRWTCVYKEIANEIEWLRHHDIFNHFIYYVPFNDKVTSLDL